MRVVALGAGGMGRYAARTASTFDFVDELVVADLDERAARTLADDLDAPARGVAVDVTDPAALARLLDGADAVLNTVGPFFRLGPPVLEAAIAAGCHYLDLNDDWESTEAMLALGPRAEAAGVTAVIGMGASPGLTNLLAALAVRELDRAEAAYPGFDLDAAMPETRGSRPCAASVHGVHQLSGHVKVFEGGAARHVRPMRTVTFTYPGLGPSRAWIMGHPEAITLPRTFPDLDTCLVLMTTKPVHLAVMRALRRLVDAGLVGPERAAGWIERLEGAGGAIHTAPDYLRELAHDVSRPLPPLFAVARGLHDGAPAWVGAAITGAPPSGMGGATGVPLAVALAAVRDQLGVRPGVFPPEAILHPRAFFDRLAPLCSPARRGADDLVLVTRSWAPDDLRERLRALG